MAASKGKKGQSNKASNPVNLEVIAKADAAETAEQVKALKLDYHIDEKDFFNAGIRYMYTNPNIIISLVLCVFLLSNVIWQAFFVHAQIPTSYLVLVIVAILIPTVFTPLTIKTQSVKMVNSNVSWEKHQRLNINAKGITATGKKTGHRYKWEEFRHIKEDKKYFFFCADNATKYILPKAEVSADELKIIRDFIKKSSRGTKRTRLLNN